MQRSILLLILLVLASTTFGTGCVRVNKIVVEQPFAPQSQQQMELTSRWGWFANRDGRQILILEFPLPAAVRGFRAFRVYAEMPAGDGLYSVSETSPARAFFVQEVGQLQGKVVIQSGTIDVRPVQFADRQRQVILDLQAANGFRLSGDVRAVLDGPEIERFLRDFRPDVLALRDETPPTEAAATQPALRETSQAPAAQPQPAPQQDPGDADTFLFEEE